MKDGGRAFTTSYLSMWDVYALVYAHALRQNNITWTAAGIANSSIEFANAMIAERERSE